MPTDEVTAQQIKPSRGDTHGRRAKSPLQIGWRGWWQIGRRVIENIKRHNISLIAAGVALFMMLAIFPALNIAVSLYAFFASPASILAHLEPLQQLLPAQAYEILTAQLTELSDEQGATFNFTLIASLVVGFWVARKGARAVITACNVVYDEYEQRSFIGLMAVSIVFTVIGVFGFVALALLAILLPIALDIMPLGSFIESFMGFLRWPIMAVLFILVLQCIYRFAPDRKNAKWRWVSVGAVIATAAWIVASIGFTIYVQNFSNFNETYGAIGSVIVLILWFYISALVVLVGAEINAEMEHQTEVDSTVGEDKPMGERGAYVADTLGAEPKEELTQ